MSCLLQRSLWSVIMLILKYKIFDGIRDLIILLSLFTKKPAIVSSKKRAT